MQLSCSVSPIPDCKDTTIPFTCKHEKGTFRRNPLFLRRNPYFYRQNRVSFSPYTYIYICIEVARPETLVSLSETLVFLRFRCIFCNYLEIWPLNPEIWPNKKAAVFLKNPPPFLENLPRFLENLPTFWNYCCNPWIVRSFFWLSALFM